MEKQKRPKGPKARKATREVYPKRIPTPEQDRSLTLAFGRQIRAYRKEAKLTLEQMAAITGMCASRLHKLEKGRVSPWVSDLMTFAGLHGMTAEEMFLAFAPSGRVIKT